MTKTMNIPILLDDLIFFAMAIVIATLSSLLGAWAGRSIREMRLLQVPEWRPTRNGALLAAAILLLSGVGALWWAGYEAVNFGLFGLLFWNKREINQGLIGLAWMSIFAIGWVAAVCVIGCGVAFISACLCSPDPKHVRGYRFSLRTFFILIIATSVALGLWIGARQKSINYERAVDAARTAWHPYGLEPRVARWGEVWGLERTPGKPVMKLSEQVFHDLADLPGLEILDLSDLAIPEHAFEAILDLPRLHLLRLSGTDITDQQLKTIAKLRVSLLFLEDTGISDAGLQNLAPLMQQKFRGSKPPGVTLHVHNTQVTPAGIVELKNSDMAIGGTWYVNTEPRRKKSLR